MPPKPNPDPELTITRRVALGSLVAAGGGLWLANRAASSDGDDDKSGHDSDHDTPDTPDDEGKVAPLGTVPAGSLEVRIVDDDADAFQPGAISIDPGQSVTFVNLDDDPHTATGADFDTGIMQPGEQQTITFELPGTYPYACLIHPVMTGVVEVSGLVASPVASPAASPIAGSATFEVTVADFSFEPAELAIPAGSVVTWNNTGAAPHTATASDKTFDTGVIDPGSSAEHTFAEAGTFAYFCAFHPNMTATIVVT